MTTKNLILQKSLYMALFVFRFALVVTVAFYFVTENFVPAFQLITILLISYFSYFLNWCCNLKIPVTFTTALTLFAVASILLGSIFGYYDSIEWWDDLLHFSAGVILGIAGFLIFYTQSVESKIEVRPLWSTVLVALFVLAAAAVWELFEFFADYLFGTNMQPSNADTMWDMILASIGSLPILFLGYFIFKRGDEPVGVLETAERTFLEKNPNVQ